MAPLTRDVLIKTIVADEVTSTDGNNYIQNLKNAYHFWEHESSDSLCRKYNSIKHTNISVEILES
tara:strand:+ start:334 stop:528 length:195 start_codon:yes stop_codon:yes gene_type:complete